MEPSHGVLLVSTPHDLHFGAQVEARLMHFLKGLGRHRLFIIDAAVRFFLLGYLEEVISVLQRPELMVVMNRFGMGYKPVL